MKRKSQKRKGKTARRKKKLKWLLIALMLRSQWWQEKWKISKEKRKQQCWRKKMRQWAWAWETDAKQRKKHVGQEQERDPGTNDKR